MSKDQRETSRTEAFSDGVIAFVITLLVLNLKDPLLDPALSQKSLFQGLLLQWPAFFAFVTSFATILIMWVNHHNMFTYIRRVDTPLLFLNGLLLFFVVLTAFTTLLVASHVGLGQTNDGRTAVAFYTGNAMILGLVWSTIVLLCEDGARACHSRGDTISDWSGALCGRFCTELRQRLPQHGDSPGHRRILDTRLTSFWRRALTQTG